MVRCPSLLRRMNYQFHAETQDKSELESARVVGIGKGFTVACLFLVSLQLNSQLVIDYFKINGGLCSVVK